MRRSYPKSYACSLLGNIPTQWCVLGLDKAFARHEVSMP